MKGIRQIEGLRHVHPMADGLSQRLLWKLKRVTMWSFSDVTPFTNTKYACALRSRKQPAQPLFACLFIIWSFLIEASSLVLQGDSSGWRHVPLRCRRAHRCYGWSRCYGNLCLLHPLLTHEPGEAVAASNQRPHSPQQEPGQHRPAGIQCKTFACPDSPSLPFAA